MNIIINNKQIYFNTNEKLESKRNQTQISKLAKRFKKFEKEPLPSGEIDNLRKQIQHALKTENPDTRAISKKIDQLKQQLSLQQ